MDDSDSDCLIVDYHPSSSPSPSPSFSSSRPSLSPMSSSSTTSPGYLLFSSVLSSRCPPPSVVSSLILSHKGNIESALNDWMDKQSEEREDKDITMSTSISMKGKGRGRGRASSISTSFSSSSSSSLPLFSSPSASPSPSSSSPSPSTTVSSSSSSSSSSSPLRHVSDDDDDDDDDDAAVDDEDGDADDDEEDFSDDDDDDDVGYGRRKKVKTSRKGKGKMKNTNAKKINIQQIRSNLNAMSNNNNFNPLKPKGKSLDYDDGIPSSSSLHVGQKVRSKYNGSAKFYNGTIRSVNTYNGTYEVLFDDGDKDPAVLRGNIEILGEDVAALPSSVASASHGTGPNGRWAQGDLVDFQVNGLWFPGEVKSTHYNGETFEVNHSDWPAECAQVFDMEVNTVVKRGTMRQKYYRAPRPAEVFDSPPIPPPHPEAKHFEWAEGMGNGNGNAEGNPLAAAAPAAVIPVNRRRKRGGTSASSISFLDDEERVDNSSVHFLPMLLGRHSILVVTDCHPHSSEFYETLVPLDQSPSSLSLFRTIQFFLFFRSKIFRPKIKLTEILVRGKSSPTLASKDGKSLIEKIKETNGYKKRMFAKENNTSLDPMLYTRADVPSDGELSPISTDTEERVSGALSNADSYIKEKTKKNKEKGDPQSSVDDYYSSLPSPPLLRTFQMEILFYIHFEAERVTPKTMALSLMPLNSLMKILFPHDKNLSAMIQKAERPLPSTVLNNFTPQRLMDIIQRDQKGFPILEKEEQKGREEMREREKEKQKGKSKGNAIGDSEFGGIMSVSAGDIDEDPSSSSSSHSTVREKVNFCEPLVSRECDLLVTLRDYQVQAFEFLRLEESPNHNTNSHLWVKLPFGSPRQPDPQTIIEQSTLQRNQLRLSLSLKVINDDNRVHFYYSPYLQRFKFCAMPITQGGFQCQSMGLGKTMTLIALINKQFTDNQIHDHLRVQEEKKVAGGGERGRGNGKVKKGKEKPKPNRVKKNQQGEEEEEEEEETEAEDDEENKMKDDDEANPNDTDAMRDDHDDDNDDNDHSLSLRSSSRTKNKNISKVLAKGKGNQKGKGKNHKKDNEEENEDEVEDNHEEIEEKGGKGNGKYDHSSSSSSSSSSSPSSSSSFRDSLLPTPTVIPPLHSGLTYSAATLIITPVSLLGQWISELKTRSSRPLRICAFYGSSRPKRVDQLANFDVILSSYGVVGSEKQMSDSKKKKLAKETPHLYKGEYCMAYKSVLHQIHFHRIVLDESHTIRTGANLTTRSIKELSSTSKYLVTGTPIATTLNDLHSQCTFLDMKGLVTEFWSNVDKVITKGEVRTGRGKPLKASILTNKIRMVNTLIAICTENMIRHVREQPFNGRKTLLTLPKKSTFHIKLEFSDVQRELYDKMFTHAFQRFRRYKSQGVAVSRCVECIQMLIPSRQSASYAHIARSELATRMALEENADDERKKEDDAKHQLQSEEFHTENLPVATKWSFQASDDDCVLCLGILTDAVQTKCGHLFDAECATAFLATIRTQNCPICRNPISVAELMRPKARTKAEIEEGDGEGEDEEEGEGDNDESKESEKEKGKKGKKRGIAAASSEGSSSSSLVADVVRFDVKMKYLLSELKRISRLNSNLSVGEKPYKALIFTQFTTTMEGLKKELTSAKIAFGSIEGGMSMSKRKKNIEMFQADDKCFVFLLSVRAGAVGITLTAASTVYIMEPCLNPSLEAQAVGRVQRMGQERDIEVKYLIMKDSIEENIMEINKVKRAVMSKKSGSGSNNKAEGEGDEGWVEPLGDEENAMANHMAAAASSSFSSSSSSPSSSSSSSSSSFLRVSGPNASSVGSLMSDRASAEMRMEELDKLFNSHGVKFSEKIKNQMEIENQNPHVKEEGDDGQGGRKGRGRGGRKGKWRSKRDDDNDSDKEKDSDADDDSSKAKGRVIDEISSQIKMEIEVEDPDHPTIVEIDVGALEGNDNDNDA